MRGRNFHANGPTGATAVTDKPEQVTLPEYKMVFIEGAMNIGALTLNEEKKLKSDRQSPFFFNMGKYSDGDSTKALAKAYAQAIKTNFIDKGNDFDIIYGIPEKGVGFAVAVAAELSALGVNKGWCFSRKMPKDYGDATGKPTEFVGQTPKKGDRVLLLDDVIITGGTKDEAMGTMSKISGVKVIGLVIALDRQEVGIDGQSTAKKFEETYSVPIVSIINAADINTYLIGELDQNPKVTKKIVSDFQSYMRAYGTDEAIKAIGIKIQAAIFEGKFGVIPACDGLLPAWDPKNDDERLNWQKEGLDNFAALIEATASIDGIVGYKTGRELADLGLIQIGFKTRHRTNKPLMHDDQKFGGDVPDTNLGNIRSKQAAGIVNMINFPESGPETQRSAIYRALQREEVLVGGGWMTHQAYEKPNGAFAEEYILNAYRIWARSGITTFVVPATKPDVVKKIVLAIEEEYTKLGYSDLQLSFVSPGIGAQGGDTKALKEAVGSRHSVFAIEGRAIITQSTPDASPDMTERAKVAVEKLRKIM
ncbi:MAG: phosphoribosyltransferase family protein, partial [Candidatus Micrarchaeales archaeon]